MNDNMHIGLDKITTRVYREITRIFRRQTFRNMDIKKISILGNSLGGLVAKKLIVELKNGYYTLNENIKLRSFVTTVTPHMGIGGSYTPLNIVRQLISILILDKTGMDLMDQEILEKTETKEFFDIKFENRVDYCLSAFDLNVPFWSCTKGIVGGVQDKENIIDNVYYLNGKFVFIPLDTCLNHGNVVGKHLNNTLITWKQDKVLESMKHIRSQFE